MNNMNEIDNMEAEPYTIQYIDFIFNYCSKTFRLSIEYLREKSIKTDIHNNKHRKLKTILKDECLKYDIVLYEDNLVLVDLNANSIIETVNDLINYKTKICKILIIPIKCEEH
uniref:Uncharacterized protein n=1 Tax=viral metagenome TaxID=1070528 RepID=A0A6C0EYA9_9ZZZZ